MHNRYSEIEKVTIYPKSKDKATVKITRNLIHLNIFTEETIYVNKPFYLEVMPANIKIHDKQLVPSFEIEKVIFNGPTTIVKWKDGTKTVVKCQEGDNFDPEKGIAMCFTKKALGNKGNFNNVLKKHMPKVKTIEININLGHCVKEALENFSKAYFGGKNNGI